MEIDHLLVRPDGDSLQWFIQHAAGPETGLVQQHVCKVSHLRVRGPLVTARKENVQVSMHLHKNNLQCKSFSLTMRDEG